jgi:hypothetical protein
MVDIKETNNLSVSHIEGTVDFLGKQCIHPTTRQQHDCENIEPRVCDSTYQALRVQQDYSML